MTTRTVLITGSTSGIGLGIARSFARAKYNIIFNGLEKNGSELAAGIANEFQVGHLYSPANALDSNQLRTMVDEGLQKFKHIDVLINNCGIQHVAPIENFPDDKWADILRINLTSAFILTKALLKPMKENKFGRIINVASAHGLFASEYKSAYVAAKHGILGLTKVMYERRLSTGKYAIKRNPMTYPVKFLLPAYFFFMIDDILESEVIPRVILQKQAVKKFVPIELIGKLALLLADEQSATLTGAAIPVDGGWSAQ
ncbi:unnamed protein product [Rotaria socialis]